MRVLILVLVFMFTAAPYSSAFEFKWRGKDKTMASKKAEIFYREARGSYGSADYQNAIKHASKAIKVDPNFAKAYALLGKVQKDMGELDSAIKDLNMALSLNPGLGEAYFIRGQVSEILGEMDKAKTDYQKGCKAGYKSAC